MPSAIGAPSVPDVAASLPGAWHVEIARASDGFVAAAFNWGADNRAEIEKRARHWIEANGMRFGSRLIVATVEPLVERATGKEPG